MLHVPLIPVAALALLAAGLVAGLRARVAGRPSLWLTYNVCCMALLGPVLVIALPLSGTVVAVSAFVLAPLPGAGIWLWRGAHRRHDDEPGDDDSGGGGGDGPDPRNPLPGSDPVDWAAFETQFWSYVRERELVRA
jgi:hypothetical protein